MAVAPTTRRVIVLCDGTWCGPETNTRSNIHFLARMIGINMGASPAEYTSPPDSPQDVRARYFDGVGLNGDFMNYLWNGALATRAKDECTEVYRYIVQNSVWNEHVCTEVWMFGISRGAYIIRSVAGLINNCGIIRDPRNEQLIDMAYDLYRSPHAVHHPSSPEMVQFRTRDSYPVQTPIKFMGIFDTVGSRGVPKLNYHTGTGFEWPEFYDNVVSTTVEKVYHAVAIHDRFWAFQPCLVSRQPRHTGVPALADLRVYQRWFPGCHYDLARQEFQFLREGGNWLESALFPILNIISKTVLPNQKLSDLVLIWILEGISTEGGGAIIQYDLDGSTRGIAAAITDSQQQLIFQSPIGTGDMYDNVLSYLPGGRLLSRPLQWLKNLNATAYTILFRPMDRMIPDPGMNRGTAPVVNDVYRYDIDNGDFAGRIIENIAAIGNARYPSRTYETYINYMNAVGRPP